MVVSVVIIRLRSSGLHHLQYSSETTKMIDERERASWLTTSSAMNEKDDYLYIYILCLLIAWTGNNFSQMMIETRMCVDEVFSTEHYNYVKGKIAWSVTPPT